MAFCSPRELVEAAQRGHYITGYNPEPNSYSRDNVWYRSFGHRGPLTLARAREIVESVKAATKVRAQGKVNRPYELVPLQQQLDPNQPWIGWEIECGWANRDSYHNVVDYIWRYQPHVTVDTEGHGAYASEITFSPENADKMWAGKGQVQRFLNWVARKGDAARPSQWRADSHIGTHCNISTPAYREYRGERYNIISRLTTRLHTLTGVQCRELFGRSQPYGWAYGNGSGRSAWIEFKLFNSTLNTTQFAKYVRVSKGLAALIDTCIPEPRTNVTIPGTVNLTEQNSETVRSVFAERNRVRAENGMHAIAMPPSIQALNVHEFLRDTADGPVPLIFTPFTVATYSEAQRAQLIAEGTALFAAQQSSNNS